MQEEEYYTKLFIDSILLTDDNLNIDHRKDILQKLYNHHSSGNNITPNLIYINKRLYTGYFFRDSGMDVYNSMVAIPQRSDFVNDSIYNKVMEDYLFVDFVMKNPKILGQDPFRSCVSEIYEKTTWDSLYVHVSNILCNFYPNLFISGPFYPYIEIKYGDNNMQEVNYCDIYPLLCQVKNGSSEVPDSLASFLQEKFENEMHYILV